jgi:aspartate/methionine/tyrosine aminotransferase
MLQTIAAFDRLGEENAFAVLARATALAQQGRDIINLGIGQPDFRTPEHIVEAAIKALRDGHHGYTPANGLLATREAVVRRTLAMTGVEISPESVMILPGGKPTMFAAILMFGEPGADILYPDPGFPIYRSMIEFTGAAPVPGRGDAGADHAEDAAPDPQLPGQSDRRRDAAGRDREAGQGAGGASERRHPFRRDLRRHDL